MINKEVLVFTPSFRRNIAVYGSFADEFLPKKVGLLVVAGWNNVSSKLTQWQDSVVLNGPTLQENHPVLWTLPRAAHLLPQCIGMIENLKPRLVIADYRAPEGILAAQKTRTPVFVSIPAVIGSFKDTKVLKEKLSYPVNIQALLNLEKQGVKIDENMIDMIFGNFHLPGEAELIHSYYQVLPSDFRDGRVSADYMMIGNHRAEHYERRDPLWYTPTIFISFGSRIMELINEKEKSKEELVNFVQKLTSKFADGKFKVVLETGGYNILPDYPTDWLVTNEFKEKDGLPEKTIFILPGDSESFHGGLLRQMPMIIIPFVDSQKLVGERAEALGVGINLGRDWLLGDAYTSDYFKSEFINRIPELIDDIFGHFKGIRETYAGIHLISSSFYKLVKEKYHLGLPIVPEKNPDSFPLRRGQLVFGTDIARLHLEKAYGMEGRLNIRRGEPFSEIASSKDELPATIDKYLDSLRYKRSYSIDLESGMEGYVKLLQSLDIFLNGKKDLSEMCIKGLDFFAELFGVKFLIDHFDPKLNYITAREIAHILERQEQFEGKVFFYREEEKGWQEILPRNAPFLLGQMIGNMDDDIRAAEEKKQKPIPWDQGIYIDSKNLKDTEIIRHSIISIKGDDEFTTNGTLKKSKKKDDGMLLGIENMVYDCAIRLKASGKSNPSGLNVSVSRGLIEQNGENKDAVVVMLMDSLGRTAVGKADEFQFSGADNNVLLQSAFSSALKQME